MELVNLTPHPVYIYSPDGNTLVKEVQPSGVVCRCQQRMVPLLQLGCVVIARQEFGDIDSLPDPKEGTLYIVSKMVAENCPQRYDLVMPGPTIRDVSGQTIGCRGLSVLTR